jgi:hypothetical protein
MWQFHPSDRQREWHSAAVRYRFELEDLLDLSPSLDPRLERIEEELALISEVYCGARRLASIETGLPATAFPETCPYTIDQILDPDFLPGPVRDEDLQP